jgi:hypothetical protein
MKPALLLMLLIVLVGCSDAQPKLTENDAINIARGYAKSNISSDGRIFRPVAAYLDFHSWSAAYKGGGLWVVTATPPSPSQAVIQSVTTELSNCLASFGYGSSGSVILVPGFNLVWSNSHCGPLAERVSAFVKGSNEQPLAFIVDDRTGKVNMPK